MTIKDVKDLKQIIDLCRKTGVQSIKVDNVEFHLGPEPIKYAKSTQKNTKSMDTFIPGVITEDTKITTDELTAEQLLFYSSGQSDEFNEQQ